MPVLRPDVQIGFWQRLQTIRKVHLAEALADVVSTADIKAIDDDLHVYVGGKRLAPLAALHVRGEVFYPVPYLLTLKPSLLGYYRLLYGLSQKQFYSWNKLGRFQSMEDSDVLSPKVAPDLSILCQALIDTAWELVQVVSPLSPATAHELQLLTLGPQLRGGMNNAIGEKAIVEVFNLVRSLVGTHAVPDTGQVIVVRNRAGRRVTLQFGNDPDIAVVEALPSISVPIVAIEVKGGEDAANLHNRLGEAEKSHRKAKAAGYNQFWTISKVPCDRATVSRETPTTTEFFTIDGIGAPGTSEHTRFRDLLYQALGI